MIEIKFFNRGEKLLGIESKGHAGFADKGSDILCSAVSVLMQSLILGLIEVAKLNTVNYQADEKKPMIRIKWHEKESNQAYVLAKTAELSLRQIAKDYPGYIKIHSEEI